MIKFFKHVSVVLSPILMLIALYKLIPGPFEFLWSFPSKFFLTLNTGYNWLLGLIFVLVAVYLLTVYRASKRPIRVLDTKVEIIFQNREKTKYLVKNSKRILLQDTAANSVYSTVSASHNEKILPQEMTFEIFINNKKESLDEDGRSVTHLGDKEKNLTSIVTFGNSIPKYMFNALFPGFLFNIGKENGFNILKRSVITLETCFMFEGNKNISNTFEYYYGNVRHNPGTISLVITNSDEEKINSDEFLIKKIASANVIDLKDTPDSTKSSLCKEKFILNTGDKLLISWNVKI